MQFSIRDGLQSSAVQNVLSLTSTSDSVSLPFWSVTADLLQYESANLPITIILYESAICLDILGVILATRSVYRKISYAVNRSSIQPYAII